MSTRKFASAQRVIPVRSGRQVNLSLSGPEFAHRRSHQGWSEQILVVDAPHCPVVLEIHNQRAHYRAIFEMGARGCGVDIGHQAITQAMIVDQPFAHSGIALAHDVGLALRKLAMAAEQRGEGPELEPAEIEFAPLGDVFGILPTEPILQREAANVVRPVGHARDAQVESGADLVAQILPSRRDIAGPERRGGTLHTAEAAAGEDKRSLPGLVLPQPFENALSMDERIGIEDRGTRHTGRGRSHLVFALLDREVGMPIGLGRIHPPRIEAQRCQRFCHLAPVDLARLGAVGIVKSVGVALPDPIELLRFQRPLVKIAFVAQFPGVCGRGIKLGPDRNHDAAVELVYFIHHGGGVGKALGIEAVAAPAILGPIEPVLHDIIDWNALVAIALHHVEQFSLRIVALARLPETVNPARHHRCLACQAAVSGDAFVHCRCLHHVIVDRLARLAGEAHRIAIHRWQRIGMFECDVALVGLPLDPQLDRLARGKIEFEIVVPWIPVLPPAVEHQLVSRENLHIGRRIEPELVRPRFLRREATGPDDPLRFDCIALRILTGRRCFDRNIGFLRPALLIFQILVVDGPLQTVQYQPIAEVILRLPIESELLVWLRIADARDRRIVP